MKDSKKSWATTVVAHRVPPVLSVAAVSVMLLATVITGQAPLRLSKQKSSANAAVFSASPNPIPVCDGSGVGTTTLSWNVGTNIPFVIHQNGETGLVVAQGAGSGTQQITAVANGSQYYLYTIDTTGAWQFIRDPRTGKRGWKYVQTTIKNFRTQLTIQHTDQGCHPIPIVGGTKLLVRTSHSVVDPGGYYILYASEPTGTNIRPFNGQLDYKLTFCPELSLSQCTNSTGPWLQVSNGQIRVNLPSTIAKGIYKAQFRPSEGSDIPWSDVIQVNVGNAKYGLENMQEYWIMPESQKAFEGTNHVTGQSFETRVGYRPAAHGCSWMPAGTKEMYFIKDHKDGYWQPNYDTQFTGEGGGSNLLWYIAPWQKGTWDNVYLSAVGHRGHPMPDQISLDLNKNFLNVTGGTRYGSGDPRYPGYILSPQWVGPGYGVANNQQLYLYDDGGMRDICQVNEESPGRGTGTWVVHIDNVTLQLPKYHGPAMRVSFWEFINGAQDIKEQWYFVKGKGLVRIEQKLYWPSNGLNALQCATDPDCYNAKQTPTMTSPMTEMTLSEYMR